MVSAQGVEPSDHDLTGNRRSFGLCHGKVGDEENITNDKEHFRPRLAKERSIDWNPLKMYAGVPAIFSH